MWGSGVTFGNEIKEGEESWGQSKMWNSNSEVLSALLEGKLIIFVGHCVWQKDSNIYSHLQTCWCSECILYLFTIKTKCALKLYLQ